MMSRKQIKIEYARKLRKEQTFAESVVWKALRNRKIGNKFRRQHPLKGYILDFYCPDARLAIEIDGEIHKKQIAYDKRREKIIESAGVKVIRFSNSEAIYKTPDVIAKIREFLKCSPSP